MSKSVIQMMIDEGVGSNSLCDKCRTSAGTITNALGPWISCHPERRTQSILFVGKVARGDCIGVEVASFLEDVGAFGADFISNSSWPYWGYTRDIITSVYGDLERGLPNISFTNIVKCNNETNTDTTSRAARDFCITQNRFFWKEVEVIRPRLVVFYTHTTYDDFIDAFMPSYASTYSDHQDCCVPIGKKQMPWWDRSFRDTNQNVVLRFLRVGHPERKCKDDFVSAVSNWISQATDALPAT